MDKPISVGDLVQVVRVAPCCGRDDFMGHTFIVSGLGTSLVGCAKCLDGAGLPTAEGSPTGRPTFLARLKRFPPLGELEGQRSEDEMDIFDFLDA